MVYYLFNSYDSMNLYGHTIRFLRYLFHHFRFKDIIIILDQIKFINEYNFEDHECKYYDLFQYYDDDEWSEDHESLFDVFRKDVCIFQCPFKNGIYEIGTIKNGYFTIHADLNVPIYDDVLIEHHVIVDFDKCIIIDSDNKLISFNDIPTKEEKAYHQLFRAVIQEIKYY